MASKQILPSRMTLQQFKTKSIAAKKGYQLLKKKADALKKEFTKILGQILEVKKKMGKDFNACMLTLAEANWAAGQFSRSVQDQVKVRAQIKLSVSTTNTAGCKLPVFAMKELEEDSGSQANPIGLTAGGQVILKCKDQFKKFLNLLIRIASLQTSFITLDEVIKITNRRVNALDYVVIPSILGTVKHIQKELDELDREDFFRLKKVKDKNEIKKTKAMNQMLYKGQQNKQKGGDDIGAIEDIIDFIQSHKGDNEDELNGLGQDEDEESDEEGGSLFD